MAISTAVAAASCEERHQDRAEQLKQLRRQMAAVTGRIGVTRTATGRVEAPEPTSESLLTVPDLLAETLPGGLPRGTVAVLSGARSLPVSMVAAVTAAGGHAAIVGQPNLGLLAAVEMGADLSRLAVIPDPGSDPVEIAAVLVDGMDLVVLGLAGTAVAPSRARVLAARVRQRGCALVVTDGDWPGAPLRLEARVRGYDTSMGGLPGCGRVSGVRLAVRGTGRGARGRAG